MKIIFNGKEFEIKENVSLEEFLKNQGLLSEKIAVEVNLEVIPKSSYSSFFLTEGMKIEAIKFVGGG